MALQAAQEPYLQVQHPVTEALLSGTDRGIGMLQAGPLYNDTIDPFFLHANGIKWSMSEFMCDRCGLPMSHWGRHHLENPTSPIHGHLVDGRRIFEENVTRSIGVDPEPMLWMSFEHSACRSNTWGNQKACDKTREHMRKTFGFSFKGEEKLPCLDGRPLYGEEDAPNEKSG